MDFLSRNDLAARRREQNAAELEEARLLMNKCGFFPVENDVIFQVHIENAIGIVSSYLRKLPKRLWKKTNKFFAEFTYMSISLWLDTI